VIVVKGRPTTSEEEDNKSDVAALIASNTNSSARNNCTNKDINSILQEDTRNVWFLDCGVSKHISFRREWFSKFRPSQDKLISMGENTTCEIKGSGTISAKRLKNGVWLDINLENVQYVPDFKKNLISVGACSNKGLDISFDETVKICNEKEIIVQGVRQDNNIYRLLLRSITSTEINVGSINSMKLWHARLGHVNKRILVETKKK